MPTTLLRRTTRSISLASRATALGLALATCGIASAQQIFSQADWKESDAPPPPAFDQSRLVSIEMPPYMSLKFGVDPKTITITGDGVVRYVVVATNKEDGGLNAFYEGVRCSTEESKVYARYVGGTWNQVPGAEWKRIDDRNSRYTKELARQGVCQGHAPRRTVSEILFKMKNPVRNVE